MRHFLSKDWIPWKLVRRRHATFDLDPLIALMGAYEHLLGTHPVTDLAVRNIPPDPGGCLRCGVCCSFMRPGPVSVRTFDRWQKECSPVADFFQTAGRGGRPSHVCWYFNRVRLRMCPLMLRNVRDGRAFCSVHHLGPKHRHPACSGYRPNPPLCEATAYSLGD